MATRTRASTTSNTPMKDKRGTSPSNTGPTPRKIAQKNNSPAKSHDPAAATGKPVPNYLKATLSSGLDKTKGDKAFSSVSTNDASNKLATVNRRRSFDKPQPPYSSQAQQIRSRVSPNPMSRSSSSSPSRKISSASSQKTASDKGFVRGTSKDGGHVVKQQHSLYPKSSMGSNINNAKKRTTAVYVKKQVIGTSNGPSMMKEEEVAVSPIEKAEDDHNASDGVTEAEVVEHEVLQESKAEDGNEKEDDLESEEVGANDHETQVIESGDDAKVIVTDESSSTVTEQQHDHDDESVGVKGEEEAEEETSEDDAKEETIIKEVSDYNNDNNNHENEIVAADNINDPSDDVKENDEKEESSKSESNETANASEASHEEAKETGTDGDDQVKEEVAAEKKPENYQGKRESAVSNDVIEETASKLREQRKNKVKALAGAFETVISLQDSK